MDDMKHEMICISCPMGCHLKIERISDSEIAVTGNRCIRGEQYAKEEILSPRRMVTATCRVKTTESLFRPRRVPVRTTKAFPREKIAVLLAIIYGLEVELPAERGQVLVADALGTGIDVVVTRTM